MIHIKVRFKQETASIILRAQAKSSWLCVMDSGRAPTAARRCIQSLALNERLLKLCEKVRPKETGYHKRLEEQWQSDHPIQTLSGASLAARRNRIMRKRLADPDEDPQSRGPGIAYCF